MKAFAFAAGFYMIAALSAQQQPSPVFEVASVKLAPPRSGNERLIAVDSDPGMVRYSNITLQSLIARAYGFDSRRIVGGPAWLDEQTYDVVAKLPPGGSKDLVAVMLRRLLEERFKLTLHRESKEQRVFFLVVGKNGPKLKKVESPDQGVVEQTRGDRAPMQLMPGRIRGRGVPVGVL